MSRLATLLLVLMVFVGFAFRSAGAFSLGQLFPASRRGVRGTLLGTSSSHKTTSNALKEAVKKAAEKETPTKLKTQQPVTNSPIYYIRLPPAPYVYMPGLGYVSPNTNNFNFLRPDVNFISNGKPSSIFHFKAPAVATTTSKTTTTTTTTTPAPTTTTMTSKPHKPYPPKTPSPITWLPGSWVFNGRPSNLFIFHSPHNPSPFDKLHQTYSKPGVYLK
ncbi:uncharacterized protein [Panulirus ornatus]|uniref:uncharacterized protein n=1 Tax=Panulirus ornatus TaxID=150431 RepID=UPI003A8C6D1F